MEEGVKVREIEGTCKRVRKGKEQSVKGKEKK